jgi:hypothetical protein
MKKKENKDKQKKVTLNHKSFLDTIQKLKVGATIKNFFLFNIYLHLTRF